ncbi:ankyrin repeat-containing domain protein [Phyllosticta citrichinensis]|uniref:Ankyrin repeat-containing domain protein n=1 Tax=Phyllosticta citrichinensis TaxID=1130410 RepID=A0ABR1XH50_9PEZI
MLLKLSFKVNSRDLHLQTPLHRAVCKDSQQMVDLLLDHDARLDIEDCHGETVWEMLSRTQDRMVEALLEASTEDLPALRHAADALIEDLRRDGEPKLAKSLITGGLDPSIQTFSGETPLVVAVTNWKTHFEVVELLLEHGIDPDIFLDEEKTLLDKALELVEKRHKRKLGVFAYSNRNFPEEESDNARRVKESIEMRNHITALLRKHGDKIAEEARRRPTKD